MKEIKLSFDKMITNLAGNRFGRETYKNQVKNQVAMEQEFCVIIPDVIEDIASSFIQGFYSELCEKYGNEKARQLMKLTSPNEYVTNKIQESIETYGV
ncbi:MAG: hypothetical protein E7293_04790 [Lachnospiraceae bacterium]|nr:hypothetical protein [Lachnospiraceae bacterium]